MDSKRGKFLKSVAIVFTVLLFSPLTQGIETTTTTANLTCDYHDSINITLGGYYDDQDYIHNGVTYNRSQYATVDYELINGTKLKVHPYIRGCICAVKPCLRTCCDPANTESCTTNYSGHVINAVTSEVTLVDDLSEQFEFTYGMLTCAKYALKPHEYSTDNYTITTDGLVQYDTQTYQRDKYCLAHDGNGTHVFVCFGEEPQIATKFKIYPFGMLLSVPCLIVTFLVYGLIPELRNLHGKNLMSYVLCLAVAYTSMSIVYLQTQSLGDHWLCMFLGYIAYTAFVCSFFWLNVLCFDIWWTFRGVISVAKNSQRRKFIYYSLYAWGCPLLILFWTFWADRLDFVSDKLKPNIGTHSCFLRNDKLIMFLYIYMIMVLQVLFNITLFLVTAHKIRKLQQETAKQISKGDSRKFNRLEADKDRYPLVRFGLYLRLFIVMGVTWMFEFISFVADAPEEWSYVTDILNSLHGFFIFFLFVWKPKIKALIVKRYRVAMGLQAPQSSHMFRSISQTTTSNVYSRQTTMNNANQMQLKSINTKSPDKLLDGDEANNGPSSDRD